MTKVRKCPNQDALGLNMVWKLFFKISDRQKLLILSVETISLVSVSDSAFDPLGTPGEGKLTYDESKLSGPRKFYSLNC